MKFFSNLPSPDPTGSLTIPETVAPPSEEQSSMQSLSHMNLGTLVNEISRNMNSLDSEI
jgi:hypothetical protein